MIGNTNRPWVGLIVGLLLSAAFRTGAQTYRVSGRVIDASTSAGITNVVVQLHYVPLNSALDEWTSFASTNTDSNGNYSFDGLPGELEGQIRVPVLLGYYSPVKETIRLSRLRPTREFVFRAAPRAALTGSVVIVNGTVNFTKFTIEVGADEADVNADGTFAIWDLPASQATARFVYQDGFYFDERVISLPAMIPGQTNSTQIFWHRPIQNVSLSGTLRDTNGNVLGGSLVQFLGMTTDTFVGMRTDANGNFAVYDLPEDCYAVRAFVGRWGVEQRALSATDSILCIGNGGCSSNNDGIPDGWRLHYFGTLSTNETSCAACDGDADGVSNLQEYRRGTDPTNPTSANITLYANSVIGNDNLDGLTPVVMASHGPKRSIQSAIAVAISGDSVQVAGDQAGYAESTFDPGTKTITLRPTGTVTILP